MGPPVGTPAGSDGKMPEGNSAEAVGKAPGPSPPGPAPPVGKAGPPEGKIPDPGPDPKPGDPEPPVGAAPPRRDESHPANPLSLPAPPCRRTWGRASAALISAATATIVDVVKCMLKSVVSDLHSKRTTDEEEEVTVASTSCSKDTHERMN